MAINSYTVLLENAITKVVACDEKTYKLQNPNTDPYYNTTLYLVNNGVETDNDDLVSYTDIYYGPRKSTDIIIVDHNPSGNEFPNDKVYIKPCYKEGTSIYEGFELFFKHNDLVVPIGTSAHISQLDLGDMDTSGYVSVTWVDTNNLEKTTLILTLVPEYEVVAPESMYDPTQTYYRMSSDGDYSVITDAAKLQISRTFYSKEGSVYTKVTDPTGNPMEKGYYELTYQSTLDTSKVTGKIYYTYDAEHKVYVPVESPADNPYEHSYYEEKYVGTQYNEVVKDRTPNYDSPDSEYWYAVSNHVIHPSIMDDITNEVYERVAPRWKSIV